MAERFFPASKPIAADGLVSSKQRGAMADSWWSQRFVGVLESFGLGGRMARGRTYARKGQVLSVDVRPGVIEAAVQGSRRVPYDVSVRLPTTLRAEQWASVEAAMRAKVGFAARLLAGEVPAELEEVFDDAGVPLFPRSWSGLGADCSCPDFENPCKHIAAVLYVFADLLDRDPWLLLAWHGRTRDEMLEVMRRGAAHGAPSPADAAAAIAPWWPLVPGTSLLRGGGGGAPVLDRPDPPHAVIDGLAPLGSAEATRSLVQALAVAYDALVRPAGDEEDGPRP